jgi:hypothetical protein
VDEPSRDEFPYGAAGCLRIAGVSVLVLGAGATLLLVAQRLVNWDAAPAAGSGSAVFFMTVVMLVILSAGAGLMLLLSSRRGDDGKGCAMTVGWTVAFGLFVIGALLKIGLQDDLVMGDDPRLKPLLYFGVVVALVFLWAANKVGSP